MSFGKLFIEERPAWEIDFDHQLEWIDVKNEFGIDKEKLREILYKLYDMKIIR